MSLFDLVGSIFSANAQKKAAREQIASSERIANQILGLQRQQYDQTRTDYAPWREAGAGALGRINDLLADPASFLAAEPGYQFTIDQGIGAITGNRAARGALDSGATLKAISDYGQNTANNYLDRIFNRYSTTAGLGSTGVSGTAAAGQSMASGSQNALTNLSSSLNSSYGSIGNANSSMWGGIAGSLSGGGGSGGGLASILKLFAGG